VVQDSRKSPTSGKYIALLGSYDPHTKEASLDKEKAAHFLKHGAQPSERVVQLFKTEKISLPKWVKKPAKHKREIRNPEKLRKNRPAEETPAAETPAEEAAADSAPAEGETAPEPEQTEEVQPAEENSAEAEPQENEQANKEAEEKPAEESEAKPEA
jgi:small subunit ribosomal protein S16